MTSEVNSAFQRLTSDLDYRAILDPEHLKAIGQGNRRAIYDESKDIWALGITVLCYVCGEDFNTFYDWTNYRVRFDAISRKMEVAESVLDAETTSVLRECLDPNELTRISVERIREVISRQS